MHIVSIGDIDCVGILWQVIVGHFVSFPREREKKDSRDEKEGQGRKRKMNESEETEEIKTSPLYPYLLQGQHCPTVSQYQLDAQFMQDTHIFA